MKNGTSLALGLIVAVAMLIAAPLAFFSAALWWSDFKFKHTSPIAASSIRDTDDATKEVFRHRVQTTFPLGSQDEKLRQELTEQGFHERVGQYRAGPAMLLEHNSNIACDYFFEVFWTSSDAGQLTGVDADLNRRCL